MSYKKNITSDVLYGLRGLGQLALDFQPGILSLQRGEEGLLFLCEPIDVTPASDTDGQCYNELPVDVTVEGETQRMYVKPISRIITTIPSVVVCNKLLPVKFFLNEYSAICQGSAGL